MKPGENTQKIDSRVSPSHYVSPLPVSSYKVPIVTRVFVCIQGWSMHVFTDSAPTPFYPYVSSCQLCSLLFLLIMYFKDHFIPKHSFMCQFFPLLTAVVHQIDASKFA